MRVVGLDQVDDSKRLGIGAVLGHLDVGIRDLPCLWPLEHDLELTARRVGAGDSDVVAGLEGREERLHASAHGGIGHALLGAEDDRSVAAGPLAAEVVI